MFGLPDLPYPVNSLEPYIDRLTMEIHHVKHHAGYVNNLNSAIGDSVTLQDLTLTQLLSDPENISADIRQKVLNNAGGHSNHSFFWTVMAPKMSAPENPFLEAVEDTFSSLDEFKTRFSAAALGHFGSGWAWLVMDSGKLDIISTPNQDSPLSLGKIPILGLDVWEHAYYLKYQNRRTDYISAWWNVVNWHQVSDNFSKALG